MSISYQAHFLVVSLVHSFPCSISETLPEVGCIANQKTLQRKTPLVEKEKKMKKEITKDHRYAMHVRQGCIYVELRSQQCFSQCYQEVREWFPCSHALFVLFLSAFFFFSSCKPWSAVHHFPFGFHDTILQRFVLSRCTFSRYQTRLGY